MGLPRREIRSSRDDVRRRQMRPDGTEGRDRRGGQRPRVGFTIRRSDPTMRSRQEQGYPQVPRRYLRLRQRNHRGRVLNRILTRKKKAEESDAFYTHLWRNIPIFTPAYRFVESECDSNSPNNLSANSVFSRFKFSFPLYLEDLFKKILRLSINDEFLSLKKKKKKS